MTTLMKRMLPDWVDAVRDHVHRRAAIEREEGQKERRRRQKEGQQLLRSRQQQQQQRPGGLEEEEEERKRNPVVQGAEEEEEGGGDGKVVDVEKRRRRARDNREELLLLSALRNLEALCHLSDGTAREVLRRLTVGTARAGGGKDDEDAGARGGAGGGKEKFGVGRKKVGVVAGGGAGGGQRRMGDGTSWMSHLFRSPRPSSSSSSSYRPRIECLRLVCTLLETNDGAVLSRLAEAPSPPAARPSPPGGRGRGGGNENGGPPPPSSSAAGGGGERDFGLAHIALRYGVQGLFELYRGEEDRGKKGGEDEDDDVRKQIDSYAGYMTRLLRDVREIILATTSSGCEHARGNNSGGGKRGNILGIDAKVR
jgi:hypothetical protein